MKIKNLIYALLIILFVGFIAYRVVSNKNKNQESKKSGDKGAPTNVIGIVLKTTTFDNNLSLSGSIEANEQVEIHSEVSGTISEILVENEEVVDYNKPLYVVKPD